jgi:tRNA-specific 2-thiouridylase
VELALPQEAIAPGQACVFYGPNDDQVLGGGWILSAQAAAKAAAA